MPHYFHPLNFTHRSSDSAFQLQISGSKSHYNTIRYNMRADCLKQSEWPGPTLCMPGSSQSTSIQGKMFQRQLMSQKIRSLGYESLGLQGDPTSPFWRRLVLGVLWKEWCWSWNSSTLATSCEELTHWKRLWCWEGLRAGGEGDNRGWDGWMASPTRWTWVWVNSGSWWLTGRPGVLRFMGSQSQTRLSDWTELNWGYE